VGKFGMIAYIFAIVLYALIGLLAVAPRIVGGLGLDATPVRVEAVLLTILVFAGVNVAWLLLFEEAPTDHASPQQAGAAVGVDTMTVSRGTLAPMPELIREPNGCERSRSEARRVRLAAR
jgi:hypothetical protein